MTTKRKDEEKLSITQQNMLCAFRQQQLGAVSSTILLTLQGVVFGDAQTKRIEDVSSWPISQVRERVAAVRSPEHHQNAFGIFASNLRAQEETKGIDKLLYELCISHIDFMSLRNGNERLVVPVNVLERLWMFLVRMALEKPSIMYCNDDANGTNAETFRAQLGMFVAVCLLPA